MYLEGSWNDSLMQYRNLLIQQNTKQVSAVVNMSPSRVQNGQIFVYPDKFYFVATLLEKPPNIGNLNMCLFNLYLYRDFICRVLI